MDVVKREIESLRGTIQVKSERGKGARFIISLPLTLAIIDGLMVESGGNRYIVPLTAVERCLELTNENREMMKIKGMVPVDDALVPMIRLRDFFKLPGKDNGHAEYSVIVNSDDLQAGLVVDSIIGNHQAVIKSLGRTFREAEGVSGATILGDGRVALIVDVTGMLAGVVQEEETRNRK